MRKQQHTPADSFISRIREHAAHSCTVTNVANGSGLKCEEMCEKFDPGANQNVVVAAFASFQPSVLSNEG